MDKITIADLAVLYHVGVPEEERAKPQRLLITINLYRDYSAACASDDIAQTINYFDVCQTVIHFGRARSWKLIESLAHDLAQEILRQFQPDRVEIEVKKFIISEARYISFSLARSRA